MISMNSKGRRSMAAILLAFAAVSGAHAAEQKLRGAAPASGTMPTGMSVSVSWDAPVIPPSPQPWQSVTAHKIYWGHASGAYTASAAVSPSSANSAMIYLPSGLWFVAVTAIDSAGEESAYSQELIKISP